MTLRAAHVLLKKYGIRTSYVRTRQGWRARETGGRVLVFADFDDESEATRAIDNLCEELKGDGVPFERRNSMMVWIL